MKTNIKKAQGGQDGGSGFLPCNISHSELVGTRPLLGDGSGGYRTFSTSDF